MLPLAAYVQAEAVITNRPLRSVKTVAPLNGNPVIRAAAAKASLLHSNRYYVV